MILTASTPAALLAALAAAHGGDTIALAPGVYDAVAIHDVAFDVPVLIAPTSSGAAVLQGLDVERSRGLAFVGIEFAIPPGAAGWGMRVTQSRDVRFSDDSVHGSLDGDPADDVGGLRVSGSSHVSVTRSRFEQLWKALSVETSDTVLVARNSFHDLRTDGVDVVASDGVQVRENDCRDFYPRGDPNADGDHPDCVQLFTGGAARASTGVSIAGNLMTRGKGRPYQCVHVRDEAGVGPFRNITIKGNRCIGGAWNGISADHVEGLKVTGNIVASWSSPSWPAQISWIRIARAPGAQISGNQAQKFLGGAAVGWGQVLGPVTDQGAALLALPRR